ncbi:MAG: hypothetical protein AVDCRST_MAG49-3944 [uncultured Thermomicrobiales bacterium]|uniref:Uncharacterized protein n=1 Tax=uncultured Thermomicrobiales bacterium TaxID=1645740 RepID=A0A6J4VCX7_9BACT|nr:MAG: hypothetical protein AVDCRST_MAG49-3944 [uncultured Thermomicrobiales bacterium]
MILWQRLADRLEPLPGESAAPLRVPLHSRTVAGPMAGRIPAEEGPSGGLR